MKDRYELDDLEIVTLLNKTKEQRLNSEDKDTEVMIRCTKCRMRGKGLREGGFSNPASTTICRDCNSLLKRTDYTTSISRKVY